MYPHISTRMQFVMEQAEYSNPFFTIIAPVSVLSFECGAIAHCMELFD
jgi:hypothetical protein